MSETRPTKGETVLPNLRTLRDPAYPWEVEDSHLRAEVQQLSSWYGPKNRNAWIDERKKSILLQVTVVAQDPQSRLVGVELKTAHSRMSETSFYTEGGRSLAALKIEMKAPAICPLSKNREPLQLEVTFKKGSETVVDSLSLDYQCLLGDVIENRYANELVAKDVAELAHRYRQDPLIQKLIAKARPFRTRYALTEIQRVKEWIRFGERTESRDEPNPSPLGLSRGIAYILSPTETVRYGGDCEDWAIFFGAYLAERGYTAQIAVGPGHARNRVHGIDFEFPFENPTESLVPGRFAAATIF